MVEKMQAACPRRAPAGRPPPAAVRHPRRQRLENRARRGRARFVDATLAFLGGLVSPAELLPAARQARPRPCPPPGAGVAARAAPRAADAHRTGWRGPGRPPHWPARPGELRARAAQARERMLARVVADALQRELAAPPPSGDPGVVLARALRLAADACALAAAMPALDDYTALRARRAPRSARGGEATGAPRAPRRRRPRAALAALSAGAGRRAGPWQQAGGPPPLRRQPQGAASAAAPLRAAAQGTHRLCCTRAAARTSGSTPGPGPRAGRTRAATPWGRPSLLSARPRAPRAPCPVQACGRPLAAPLRRCMCGRERRGAAPRAVLGRPAPGPCAGPYRGCAHAGANPSSGPLALVKDDAERLLARELAGQAYVILTKARAGGAPGRRACAPNGASTSAAAAAATSRSLLAPLPPGIPSAASLAVASASACEPAGGSSPRACCAGGARPLGCAAHASAAVPA